MRNSLQKTPPSGPRSMPPPQAAALADGAPRPAAKRPRSVPYNGVPRLRVAVEQSLGEESELLAARLRLLEGFVGRADLTDCTHLALQWLRDVLRISHSICLIRTSDESS